MHQIIAKDYTNIHKIRIELFDLDSDCNIVPKPTENELRNESEQKHQKQLPDIIIGVGQEKHGFECAIAPSDVNGSGNGSADHSGFDIQRNQTTMAYHFNEYQKVFGQLQYAQMQSNTQTVQKCCSIALHRFSISVVNELELIVKII